MKRGTYIRTKETLNKMSLAHKGQPSSMGMKGKKHSLETIQKMRFVNKGKKAYNWKGNNVSYRNLHRWVERWLGKAKKCMKNLNHKSTRYHWANISHKYKRDLTDWIQLCPSCNCKDRIGRRVAP